MHFIRYWHRSLNPKKLIDIKFSHLTRNMTMQRTLKLYKLPENTKVPGFRKLVYTDIPQARKILMEVSIKAILVYFLYLIYLIITNTFIFQYLEKFDLAPIFSAEEFEHWFLPRTGIINSFVVEKEGKITDMVSYYTLPSSIMHHQTHKTLKAAYSFYNVSTVTPWLELMMDALISARDVSLLFYVFHHV